MMHPVATIQKTPTDGELPSHAGPVGGIDVGLLDLSTRQAITYLFPKERGLTLLKLLFLSGEVRSMNLNDSGPTQVAVIRLTSVEGFARAHRWSKDTMLRYIATMEALQILSRQRHASYTEFHVPLTQWSPSEQALAALDTLLVEDATREKLQQLASGVKARFLLLYGSPRATSSLYDEVVTTLSDVSDLLHTRLSATKRQLLQVRVENLRLRLEATAQKGDFHTILSSQKSTIVAEKGDFSVFAEGQNEHTHTQKGDFQSRVGSSYLSRHAEKGDFHTNISPIYDMSSAQKGDFHTILPSQKSTIVAEKGDFQGEWQGESPQKGDFQKQSVTIVAEKGDFQEGFVSASLNDNVITPINDSILMDDVSDNDATANIEANQDRYSPGEAAKVGRQLALFLEKTPENTGGFVNKCKQCSRTVIRAAVIDMLVHAAFPNVDPADERGRPKNRASWFHDACKKYAKPGTHIPAFIEKWLRTDHSWQEIERQLNEAASRYKRYMTLGPSTADLVRQWLRGEIEQQALDSALQASLLSHERQIPQAQQPFTSASSASNGTPLAAPQPFAAVEKTWMDEGEAEVLAEEILRDAGPFGVSKAVAKQEHGVYVVALIWRGSPMNMKTPQQWRSHFERVRPHFESMERKGENNGTTK